MKKMSIYKVITSILISILSLIIGHFIGYYFYINITNIYISTLLATMIAILLPIFIIFILSNLGIKLNKRYFKVTKPDINLIGFCFGIPLAIIASALLFSGDLHIHSISISEFFTISLSYFLWFGIANGFIIEIVRAYCLSYIRLYQKTFFAIFSTTILFTLVSLSFLNNITTQIIPLIIIELLLSLTMTCITLYSGNFLTSSLCHCLLLFVIKNPFVYLGNKHNDTYFLSYQFDFNHNFLYGSSGSIHPSGLLLGGLLFIFFYTIIIEMIKKHKQVTEKNGESC